MDDENEVVFEAVVVSTKTSNIAGCLGAIATVPLIAFGVNLFAGDKLPPALEGTTPFFAVAAFILSGVTWLFYSRARLNFVVKRLGDELEFIVAGEPVFRGVVELRYGVERRSVGRGPKMAFLVCGVVSEGVCRLVLSAEWGAIHGLPENWPRKWPEWKVEATVPNLKVEGKSTLPDFVRTIEAPR